MDAKGPDRPVQPSDVAAMARYYGVDPASEPWLLWIVREALQTPLPPTWREETTAEGEPAYMNTETGEWFESHPADGYYERLLAEERARAPPPAEAGSAWLDFYHADGQVYYHDLATGAEQEERPEELIVPVASAAAATPQGGSFFLDEGDDSPGALPDSPTPQEQEEQDQDQVLHFTSWWNQAGPDGALERRMMDLYFSLESGSCQIILDASDKVYSVSHLTGKHGAVSAWDLHVGMQVDVLGRKTTLMQADLLTLEWLEHHERELIRTKRRLMKELRKYAPQRMAAYLKGKHEVELDRPGAASQFRSSHRRGARSLRGLRDQVRQLKGMLAEYRPGMAEELAGHVAD